MSAAFADRRLIRGLLIEALARRGEPVFVDGTRIAPAAAVFAAARAGAADETSTGIKALVDVLAELWHTGTASGPVLARLHPDGSGEFDPDAFVCALVGSTNAPRVETLDSERVRINDEAQFLARLLGGASVVRLGRAPGGFATF